jgi:L-alanine-DL-glutamate epimerase-like enolase superfamily enzyme
MRRRSFFPSLAAAAAAPPFHALAQSSGGRPNPKIAGIELFRVEGRREGVQGANRQFQAQPIHIYDELRPKPYQESRTPARGTVTQSELYIRILTDQGVEGLYGPIDREAAIVVELQLKNLLKGKDSLAVEKLWDQMYRSNRHSRRGHFMMGISAVDNALWDLRGRWFNAPVYRLLGGPTRPEIDVYGSCLGFSLEPDLVRERSTDLKRQGFRYQKWFLADGPGSGAEGMERNVALVRNLRDAVGDEVDLMFDAFMGWNLDYAISWAKRVEQFRPRWIEEAFSPDKIGSFVQLRRSTSIPVATGEHIYGRWETHDYLKAGAISVVQTDPEWCGGVSELVKICSLGSIFDAQVIPHGHAVHASLHVVGSQSPMTCPLVEYLFNKMSYFYWFEKYPPKPVNGRLVLSERPGFGIELDQAKIEKRTEFRV